MAKHIYYSNSHSPTAYTPKGNSFSDLCSEFTGLFSVGQENKQNVLCFRNNIDLLDRDRKAAANFT